MDWGKGIIGALSGGVSGYAAGKMNEAEATKQDNMLLIKDVLDRNLMQFREDIAGKRDDRNRAKEIIGYNPEGAPIERGSYQPGMEMYSEGVGRPESRQYVNPDGTPAQPGDPGAIDIEAWKTKYGADQRLAAVEASLQAQAGRGGGGGTSQRWGGNIDAAKQNFMGKYGVSEDPTGGFVSEPMTAEQKAQAEAEAKQMGLNVYFKKGTDDGGWFGKSKDVYTISSIAPAMGGQGIIGGQAPQGQAIGAGQQRSQNDPLGEQIAKIKKQASSVQGKPNLEIEPSDQAKPQSEAGGQKKTYERGSYTEAPTAEQRQEAIQEWAALGEKTKEHLDDAAKQTMNKGYELGIITNKAFWELARMSKDQIMRLVEWQKQAQQENPLPATRR